MMNVGMQMMDVLGMGINRYPFYLLITKELFSSCSFSPHQLLLCCVLVPEQDSLHMQIAMSPVLRASHLRL